MRVVSIRPIRPCIPPEGGVARRLPDHRRDLATTWDTRHTRRPAGAELHRFSGSLRAPTSSLAVHELVAAPDRAAGVLGPVREVAFTMHGAAGSAHRLYRHAARAGARSRDREIALDAAFTGAATDVEEFVHNAREPTDSRNDRTNRRHRSRGAGRRPSRCHGTGNTRRRHRTRVGRTARPGMDLGPAPARPRGRRAARRLRYRLPFARSSGTRAQFRRARGPR
jgi:hypothetical protein